MKYYVYGLIDPRNNSLFYIGKGSGNRVYQHTKNKTTRNENPYKANIINTLEKLNLSPSIQIFENNLEENEAYILEEKLIVQYGRFKYDKDGILTNVCKSNKPPSPKGRKHTEETKKKISNSLKGGKTANYGIKNGFYGKTHSEENKKKFSENAKKQFLGKKKTKDQIEKLKLSFTKERLQKLALYRSNFNKSEMMRNVTKKANIVKGREKTKQYMKNNINDYVTVITLLKDNISISNIKKQVNLSYNRIWIVKNKMEYFNSIMEEIKNGWR